MRLLLPHVLSAKQLNIGRSAFAFGGYSDVFKGTYDGLEVCVKRLGVDSADSPEEVAKGRIHYVQAYCLLTTPADSLPRGLDMETVNPPQRRPLQRYNVQPSPDCVRVDAGRRPDHLR